MSTQDSAPAAIYYPRRIAVLDTGYQRSLKLSGYLRLGVLLAVVGTLVSVIALIYSRVPAWVSLVAAATFAILLNRYLHTIAVRNRLQRLLLHYDTALARINGERTQSGNTGEEFRIEGHLYEHDLNILGPDSLFGLLDTVRTGVGQRGLAKLLLGLDSESPREKILGRREAIQELTPQNDLREKITMLGPSRFQQVQASFFDGWLAETPPTFHPAIRWSLATITTLLLPMLALGLLHVFSWDNLRPNILLLLAVQSAIALSLRKRVVPLLESSKKLSSQTELFRDGLALLQEAHFHSHKLKELQAGAHRPIQSLKLLNKLQQQLIIVEQRTKEWFLLPSLFLCAGTHAALSIAKWKREHAAAMQQWLALWAEFEALNALATFAYEHPTYVYPEILPTGTAVFEAKGLAHPLLSADAIANDISFNPETRLYLISGSNMAGKSTLLRSIGTNAVLANTGAPIRATWARTSPLLLGASIALTDSLAEGKSKFLAEVERLHHVLQAAGLESGPRLLFLIDEIFSGTNSLDRKVAAEAVAHALIGSHAIGALSTHDLTLTEMADAPELHAANVHMASADPTNPLAFDYRLKPGVNTSSNALAIVRMMGIHI